MRLRLLRCPGCRQLRRVADVCGRYALRFTGPVTVVVVTFGAVDLQLRWLRYVAFITFTTLCVDLRCYICVAVIWLGDYLPHTLRCLTLFPNLLRLTCSFPDYIGLLQPALPVVDLVIGALRCPGLDGYRLIGSYPGW